MLAVSGTLLLTRGSAEDRLPVLSYFDAGKHVVNYHRDPAPFLEELDANQPHLGRWWHSASPVSGCRGSDAERQCGGVVAVQCSAVQ
jgi:hypothetical protein